MKRTITFLGIAVSGLALLGSSIVIVTKPKNHVLFSDFACDHVGYHYDEISPTHVEKGIHEYWVCCKCHNTFFEAPAGNWTDAGGNPSTSEFLDDDPRWLPAIGHNFIPQQDGSELCSCGVRLIDITKIEGKYAYIDKATSATYLDIDDINAYVDKTHTTYRNSIDGDVITSFAGLSVGEHVIYATRDDVANTIYRFTTLVATSLIRNTTNLKAAVGYTGGCSTISGYYVVRSDFWGGEYMSTSPDDHSAHGFVGTFNGAGHTISGLRPVDFGIFGSIGSGAVIKNLTLNDIKFGNGQNQSTVFAKAIRGASFENVTMNVTDCWNGRWDYVGLVACQEITYSSFRNCVFETRNMNASSFTELGGAANRYIGWIISKHVANTTFNNCIAYSPIFKVCGNSSVQGDIPAGLSVVYWGPADEMSHPLERQDVDLQMTASGINNSATVTLDFYSSSLYTSINSVTFEGNNIGNSLTLNTSAFGTYYGDYDLTVNVTLTGGVVKDINVPVTLISNVIDNKTELDNFMRTASVIGGSDNLHYAGYFVLGSDIDYTGAEYTSPLSSATLNAAGHNNRYDGFNYGFKGVFDGRGHSISNMYIGAGDWNGTGFIYLLNKDGVIKNTAFLNADGKGEVGYVTAAGAGTIENVYVKWRSSLAYGGGNKGTFFNQGKYEETLFGNKGYANIDGLTIKNCFVDSSGYTKNGEFYTIGHSNYTEMNIEGVYAITGSNNYDTALLNFFSDGNSAIYETESEMKQNKTVIGNINRDFVDGVWEHANVSVPRQYVEPSIGQGLVNNNNSKYAIYVSDLSDKKMVKAANFISQKIYQYTGARIYRSTDNPSNLTNSDLAIVIGANESNVASGKTYSVISSVNGNAYLDAKRKSDFQLAAIKFLNKTIGYDVLGSDYEIAPSASDGCTIAMPALSGSYLSAAQYRTSGGYWTEDMLYGAGLTSNRDGFMQVINDYTGSGGNQYHNLFAFIPPEIYYGTYSGGVITYSSNCHTKWFTPNMEAEDGYYQRTAAGENSYSNLCFNAQGDASELAALKNTFYAKLKATVINNPDLNQITISQMDHNGSSYCSCNACKNKNPNIAIINFLNDMSSRLKEDFPNRDIYILTLAYHCTFTAPATKSGSVYTPSVIADDHVGVLIAPTTEANYSYALNSNNNSTVANNIQAWRSVTSNVSLYMYEKNFLQYFASFNSTKSSADTYAAYADMGLNYIYNLGNSYDKYATGFNAFQNYIDCRKMADVDMEFGSTDSLVAGDTLVYNFFNTTTGYYGKAGNDMRYVYNNTLTEMNNNAAKFGNYRLSNSYRSYTPGGLRDRWNKFSTAYSALDSNDPLYDAQYKHVLAESISLRYCYHMYYKYAGLSSYWLDGDSKSQFLADLNTLGMIYYAEGQLVSNINSVL